MTKKLFHLNVKLSIPALRSAHYGSNRVRIKYIIVIQRMYSHNKKKHVGSAKFMHFQTE